MARIIGYRFEGRFRDERAVERVLQRAIESGVAVEGDLTVSMDPWMSVVWFNGKPGKALRAVRNEMRALVTPADRPTEGEARERLTRR